MLLESSQSSLDVRRKAAQSSEKRTREGGERRVSRPCCAQSAVCTLQPARSGHEDELNYIERNGTGLEVAGLAGLMGLGSNSRREASPRWPLVRLGEGERAAGGRAGPDVVQMCNAGGAGCQYLQDMDTRGGDKVVPELCKKDRQAWQAQQPQQPWPSKVCRCRLGHEWVMREKRQAHLSSAGIWARLDCGNSPRRSERETVMLRQEPQKTTAAIGCSNRATWQLARVPRSLIGAG